MSNLEKFNAALAPLGVPVYPIVCPADALPESFITTIPVTESGEVYADDACEDTSGQYRASWYDRNGTTGHSDAIRQAVEAAGFTYAFTTYGYDEHTKHYATYVEAVIDG